MVQNAKPRRSILGLIVAVVFVALGFVAGVYWERSERELVYQAGGGAVALLAVGWLVSKIRRRRIFKSTWEMTVLKWHAARGQIREAVHQGHPKEAMRHAKDEAKARDELMALLRL